MTLRQAIKSAGISEQTYYQWKRAAKPKEQGEANADQNAVVQSIVAAEDFDDLVRLEAENQRLRKLLAEKLLTENAELRKRLGID
ncbi:transposase [Ensifer sp. ENS05]|nr:transposase [Ensifer sp. ENS05]